MQPIVERTKDFCSWPSAEAALMTQKEYFCAVKCADLKFQKIQNPQLNVRLDF